MLRLFPTFLFLMFCLISSVASAARFYKGDLVVLAESSVASSIVKMLRLYTMRHYANIITIFVPLQDMAARVSEADIVITSSPEVMSAFLGIERVSKPTTAEFFLDRLFLCISKDSFLLSLVELENDSFDVILKKIAQYGVIVVMDQKSAMSGILSRQMLEARHINRVLSVESEAELAHLLMSGKTAGILQASYMDSCCKGKIIGVPIVGDEDLGIISYKIASSGSDRADELLRFLILNNDAHGHL